MTRVEPAISRVLLGGLSGPRSNRRLMIFTFHRVLESPDPLLPGEPSSTDFEQILCWMSRYLNVLKLPDAAAMLNAGGLPRRAACITFDDGYRNNHDVALPLLERAGLPATFFIATHVGEQGGMWNDLVIEAARAARGEMDLREFGLAQYRVADDDDRQRLLGSVLPALKYRSMVERSEVAGRIHQRFCKRNSPGLMMNEQMIRNLNDAGHDVGAHTMHHPILAKLSRPDAETEIVGSRNRLTEILGSPPTSFAYPNGQPGVDFDTEHEDLVRAAGFSCAVSTAWGCATGRSSLMALPRFTPWERTEIGFITRLAKTCLASYGTVRQ